MQLRVRARSAASAEPGEVRRGQALSPATRCAMLSLGTSSLLGQGCQGPVLLLQAP